VSPKITFSGWFISALSNAYRRLGAARRSVLLAVSGGADSIALLLGTEQVAKELGLRLQVASLDHALRPESAMEVAGVRLLAEQRGLPFHARSLNLKPGSGMEARARAARYDALEEIRIAEHLDLIATGHTASDQAETLLMRLTRGASLKGAAGILWRRDAIVRPMLSFLRADTERFLREMGVGFVTDPMNSDRLLFRTRIRRDVLPALSAAAGAGSIQNLARFSHLAAEDSSVLDELAWLAYQRLQIGPDVLDASGVRCLEPPLRRRVLSRLVRQTGGGVDWECIDRAMEAVDEGAATPLPKGWSLRCESGAIRLVPRHPSRAVLAAVELRDEWTEEPASGIRLRLSKEPPVPPTLGIRVLQPALPLIARHRRRGDRVPSRGGRPGRKVQDVLVDSGVQAELRDIIPIVCDAGGKILWVVGVWPQQSSSEAGDDANTTCANDSWYLLAEPISESAQRFGLRYKLPSMVRG